MESSKRFISSRVEESDDATVESRIASMAWRMDMGLLSVVPGLSMRILPHVFSLVGMIRDARMIWMIVVRWTSQHRGIRARTLMVKLLRRAFEGVGLASCSRSGMGPLNLVLRVCGSVTKLNGHLYGCLLSVSI